MDENIILVDWFSFTLHNSMTIEQVKDFLGLASGCDWLERAGRDGYKQSHFCDGISIMWDGHREDMGICVHMSGQGCRHFESFSCKSFAQLFEEVTADEEQFHVTRLDVAYDDIDKSENGSGLLDIVKICKFAYFGRYISKFSKSHPEVDCDTDQDGRVTRAHSCYFGSPKSELRIRFYDKAQERGGLEYHWVRCELQLRRERALAFLKLKQSWGERFFGVLNNYMRFIVPSKTDTNRRRAPSPVWWEKFLLSVEKISLYTPKGVEYNLTKLERYLFNQAGNSIDTYIQCVGFQKFREMLKHRDSLLNANQQALIDEYKQINAEKLEEIRRKMPLGGLSR
ncbi:MAG: replication initiation factor domain-containing protein [Oscillospiraceae bacterium]